MFGSYGGIRCLRVLGVRFQGARVLECYDVRVLGCQGISTKRVT